MRTLLFVLSLGLCVNGWASDFERFGYEGRLVPGVWADEWTMTLDASLNSTSLIHHNEARIDDLCPGYRQHPSIRQTFWRQLFISLAWKESLHGPKNYIRFNNGINEGLYQINPKLRKAYDCGNVNLYSAINNIQCAAKMAKKLVDKYGSFLSGTKEGMAAYWQPLRATSKLNRRNREFILSNVSEACRTGNLEYHSRGLVQPNALDLVDVTVNGIEDLDLDPSELESDDEPKRFYDRESFFYYPASGIFFDLTR